MRILRVAQKLYPDVTGGGPYHVHAMSRDQAAMGHDVTVLTVGTRGEETRDGYRVVRRPASASPLGNDLSTGVGRFLVDAVRSGGYDVVHAHSHLYFSTNLAALASRFSDVPLAVTNHGLYSQTAPEVVFDAYLRTLGRWTFNQADTVFCYTDADKRRLQKRGINTEIQVIPNGIDTDRFTPDGEDSARLSSDGLSILFVGRLVEGKRPQDLIDMLPEVHSKFSDAEVFFAGSGPMENELIRHATETGASSSVAFLGHVPYNEMPAVYRAADVLVLPSRAEGLPRTVLEAMASGTPVVTTDLPQVRTVATKGGKTVPVGDATALATSVRDVLESDVASTLGRQGREYVAQEHRWNQTVEQTTEELSQLVNQS